MSDKLQQRSKDCLKWFVRTILLYASFFEAETRSSTKKDDLKAKVEKWERGRGRKIERRVKKACVTNGHSCFSFRSSLWRFLLISSSPFHVLCYSFFFLFHAFPSLQSIPKILLQLYTVVLPGGNNIIGSSWCAQLESVWNGERDWTENSHIAKSNLDRDIMVFLVDTIISCVWIFCKIALGLLGSREKPIFASTLWQDWNSHFSLAIEYYRVFIIRMRINTTQSFSINSSFAIPPPAVCTGISLWMYMWLLDILFFF